MNRFMKMMMKKSNSSNEVREKKERAAEPIYVPTVEKAEEKTVDYLPEFANVNTNIDHLSESIENAKNETCECIHNENVKVYRNVQAVIIEENKKTADYLIEENKKNADAIIEALKAENAALVKKVNVAVFFATLGFAFSLLHLVFDVFSCIF